MTRSILDAMGWALLFCPGDRPGRFDNAVASSDLAVLDLEDGVAVDRKDDSQQAVLAYLARSGQVVVRVNHPATDRGMEDVRAVAEAGAKQLLLPKTQSVEEIDRVARAAPGCELIASIESARGVLEVESIAGHPAVAALSWGPYDLAADMGMRAVRDMAGQLLLPLLEARNRLLIAAAAARKAAIDTVTAELNDVSVIERDAQEGAVLGFRGKFAIHPSQVEPIRAAYRPTQTQVERARRMLDAVDGRGVFLFEGEMVDEPMLRRARSILAAVS